MELQHVRVFIAVAEELHFAQAAARLHMAQPPVTRIIQQLERELCVRLFARSTRSVQLTAAGEALVQPANEILDAVERARSVVTASRTGLIGRVRVGYSGASTNAVVARLITAVRQSLPGIDISLHNQIFPRPIGDDFGQPTMSSMLRGDLNIGIGRWDYIPAGIDTRLLMVEHLVMAVSSGHRLADRASVSMAEFRDEPIVSTPQHPGSVLFDRLQRLSYTAGFEPNIVQTASDAWAALALVAAGLGSSLTLSSVPRNFCDPALVFLPLTDKIEPILLRLAWHHDHENPAVDSVLRLAEEVLPTPQ